MSTERTPHVRLVRSAPDPSYCVLEIERVFAGIPLGHLKAVPSVEAKGKAVK